jgi:hypothetical protein
MSSSPRKYYHGTAAKLEPGDLIKPGHEPEFENSAWGDPIGGYHYSRARRIWVTTSPALALLYAMRVGNVHVSEDGSVVGSRVPYVYQVRPLARHVHRDTHAGLGSPEPDRGSYWTGSPAEVIAELPITEDESLWLAAIDLALSKLAAREAAS